MKRETVIENKKKILPILRLEIEFVLINFQEIKREEFNTNVQPY